MAVYFTLPFLSRSLKDRICMSGWLPNFQSVTSSSSQVVWMLPPNTSPQSSVTILSASSRSSATTL